MVEVRRFAGIEDIQNSVGTVLGPSDWLDVTQERINQFADATGDHQWIHVDPEKAAQGPFKTTIAHGFLTLSLLPVLGWQLYDIDNVKLSVNYGVDKVRFPHPVPVNSKVRATATLAEVTPIELGLRLSFDWVIEAEGIEKPVCIARSLLVVVP